MATRIVAANEDDVDVFLKVQTCEHVTKRGSEINLLEHERIQASRDDLVIRHLGLVRSIASRFANRGEPMDDLRQAGYIGLLKAADRFDRERGVAFTTYGYPKILGEIRRHFRDRCWTIRLPRRLQNRLRDREISSARRPLSLDAPFNADGVPLTGLEVLGDVDCGFERADIHRDIVAACTTLTDRERSIVRLRFFEELSQTAIGLILGKSQMYVSRVERRALSKLRECHTGVMTRESASRCIAV